MAGRIKLPSSLLFVIFSLLLLIIKDILHKTCLVVGALVISFLLIVGMYYHFNYHYFILDLRGSDGNYYFRMQR
jgi:hypothetical protein